MVETRQMARRRAAESIFFPLEQYPFPVRKMVVENMQTEQMIDYSFSSQTAARIVQEANIRLENIMFGPESSHTLDMMLTIGPFSHYFEFVSAEAHDAEQFQVHLVTGETVKTRNRFSSEFIVNENDAKHVIGLILNHWCTVFQWTQNTSIHFGSGHNVALLENFLAPGSVRTVADLYLQGEWTIQQFEKVMQCLKPTAKVDMLSAEILQKEHLLMLTTPQIRLISETPWQFGFIVNKWAAGEAFHNLERLQYGRPSSSESRDYVEKKAYLEGINVTEWVAGRRPRFLCDIKNNGFVSWEDLRDAPDVHRADGKIGTIYLGWMKHIHFRVWRGDESVEKDKDAMTRLLEDLEKEYNEKKEEICVLNKRLEEIGKKKMRKSQKKKQKKKIRDEKRQLESRLESIEKKMQEFRGIIPQLV